MNMSDVWVVGPLGDTQLHLAVANNQPVARIKELLTYGLDVNARNKYGEIPLHFAVNNGRADVVAVLLRAGADTNVVMANNNYCLNVAVAHNHRHIVDLLVEQPRTDLNTTNIYGHTALYTCLFGAFARSRDNVNSLAELYEGVNALLAAGATVTSSVYHLAVHMAHPAVLMSVIMYGCDVDVADMGPHRHHLSVELQETLVYLAESPLPRREVCSLRKRCLRYIQHHMNSPIHAGILTWDMQEELLKRQPPSPSGPWRQLVTHTLTPFL